MIENPKLFDLDLIDYRQAYSFQKEIFGQVGNGTYRNALIFCRHHPVITLGRTAKKSDILISDSQLKAENIDLYHIERGGELTYHGPGQLIVYPIFNLSYLKKDIHFFLRWLEGLIVELLDCFGVSAQIRQGLTGVWVGQKKIASIGIAIKKWITFHGLSINVTKEDLDKYKLIRPCGMNIAMTSMESELGQGLEFKELKKKLNMIIIERMNKGY